MALPPKFQGHRLTFTDSVTYASSEPLHTLEFYLDYVCRFSSKMFNTLTAVITHIRANPSLRGRVQIIFRQQIQPWHPSSTLVHEAALAVQRLTTAGGDAAKFWDFSAALFRNQTAFFDEAVAGETRGQTYARLARLAAESVGVDEAEMGRLLEVKQGGDSEAKNAGNAVSGDVKTIVKMARLTGVHVTPTVVFNGVVVGEISSGWSEMQWEEWLEKNIV